MSEHLLEQGFDLLGYDVRAEAVDRLRDAGGEGATSVTAVAEADPAIPDGVVWLPIHHPKTNDLTIPAADPQSTEPNLKQCAVRLVRAETAAAVPGGETA
jgi:6-phosphogluconate dehydrogenase (decarboxylating)